MPTDKQIAANRRNAQKSTGPRTPAGKRQSRLNAFKHGLTGHLEPAPDAARDAFAADILASLQPAGPIERQLAHSIADAYWRLNRISVIESHLLAGDLDEDPLPAMNTLTTYEMRLHRKVKSDLAQLREIQSARRAEEAKTAEQAAAAERRVFDEACTLLELKLRLDPDVDLDGTFTHPNGFVFSIPKLLDSMTINRRLQRARQCVTTNPFTVAELESMLPA